MKEFETPPGENEGGHIKDNRAERLATPQERPDTDPIADPDIALAALMDDYLGRELPRDEHDVPTPDTLEALRLLTGVDVKIDATGLPTEDTLEALATKGAVGRIFGHRLLAEDLNSKNHSPEQRALLQRFDDHCAKAIDSEEEESEQQRTRVLSQREATYKTLLPYDTSDNPVGQKVADWMRQRMQFGLLDRPDANKWRTPLQTVSPEALRDLSRIIGEANSAQFKAIFPGLQERELKNVFNDPHVDRLVTMLSNNIDDEKLIVQIGEIAALQRYVKELPHSMGGLREILTSLAESAIGRVQNESRRDPEVAQLLQLALNSHALPRTSSSRQPPEKQDSHGMLAGIKKRMQGWFGG